LEKQRQNFARFYFVGDEDLLEIIGNSKEIKNIQRHFPKMFAGVTTVCAEKAPDDADIVTGMNSREGETVKFSSNINISEESTIYKWLGRIESMMQESLANILSEGVVELELIDRQTQPEEFNNWICKFAAQIVLLSLQVSWSKRVEDGLNSKKEKALILTEQNIQSTLAMLAERVLTDLPQEIRKKYEQLITDLVHQGEVTKQLISQGVQSAQEFTWLYHMRFYWQAQEKNPLHKLAIRMSCGLFYYGFEYLGVAEKLVQTPLTDKCYLTLTQALHWRMGGAPFGPAGTGKTESVKALGSQLGIFVLVFNCDDTFDGNAMSRIFIGLCQVGAWGCFDEFNRLEERMLSAVSQSILQIQTGLKEDQKKIDLMGRDVKLNQQMGIFITMNLGYAGRSQLPDNLKQLFRMMAMTVPDKVMIGRVMLYSQGFITAVRLSGKIVSLFDLCKNQLSDQSHYDFGLRALKSVLVSSGNLKRSEKAKMADPSKIDEEWEQGILIKSLCDTLIPKLIQDDIPLLDSLLKGVFPGTNYKNNRDGSLKDNLIKFSPMFNLIPSENFIEKVMQLYQIQNLHHGLMMVGPTGCGKTAAWKLLLHSMEADDKIKGEAYVVDPKAINKDDLYGKLDSTTAEWTDGVFTGILRKVIDNARGEMSKRHWIIFDGDVDPLWAENLNSVLDDNRLLTLPSGERLTIPYNVRIMFEVETLKHATLATVSRCGMIWFSEETIDTQMMYYHYLQRLK
jgi:dynein heavy chain 1